MTESQRSPSNAYPSPTSLADFPMPWSMLCAYSSAIEPVTRTATRAGMELQGLAGLRTRSYMEVPQALARCRTPFDLMQAQLAFWQEAGQQYADTAQRLARVWQSAMPWPQAGEPERSEPRDAITFPEPRNDGTDDRRRPGDTRRAA